MSVSLLEPKSYIFTIKSSTLSCPVSAIVGGLYDSEGTAVAFFMACESKLRLPMDGIPEAITHVGVGLS